MENFVVKSGQELKIGYTTGSCATAATKASLHALFCQNFESEVTISLPTGKTWTTQVLDPKLESGFVSCAVKKYSGDDPDVTDGILIYAKVSKIQQGIHIDGGVGVGRVTKPGLSCKVGEAAINPVPRSMIQAVIVEMMGKFHYQGGIAVEIFVPEGERVAKHTFNARLGILGGISILGTSGLVEPMSEDALIDTIKAEMNQKNPEEILFAAPGNYGLDFAKNTYGIDLDLAVKYSNYTGELLDYARYLGFKRMLIIGHIGKMVKLAAGIMNSHSKMADGRNEIFAAHAALAGAKQNTIEQIMEAATTDEIHVIIKREQLNNKVYKSLAKKIAFQLEYRTKGEIQIEFIIFSNVNGLLMESKNAREYLKKLL